MKKILGVFYLSLVQFTALSQGCSDAGACSLSDIKPELPGATGSNGSSFIKLGANYGLADYNIAVAGGYIEYGRQLSRKVALRARLTAIAQSGNDISTFGLSDLYLTGIYNFKKVNIIGGLKVPLNDATKSQNGRPLPMDYQSSLGTLDLIVGIADSLGRLKWSISYQQPLTQNSNQFDGMLYPEGSVFRNIPTTAEFDRAGDLLARLSYPLELTDRLTLTPGMLPIYHLRNDRYTDEMGVEQQIEGSRGLTLNFNLFADFALNDRNSVQLAVGAPALVRDERPDGLTRSFVINLEYRI